MPHANDKPRKTQRKFGTIWGELDYVCKRTHYWLHVKKSPAMARRYKSRLERILKRLPENNLAILRHEGLALLYELKGQRKRAITHRQREIELTKRLQASVRKSVEAGDYDRSTGAWALAGRHAGVLQERRAILQALKEEERARRAEQQS